MVSKIKIWIEAASGEATKLIGDSLETAIKEKSVITKAAYAKRQINRQVVDATTGKATQLHGDALITAKKEKRVITKAAYAQRQRNRQFVDAATGISTKLKVCLRQACVTIPALIH